MSERSDDETTLDHIDRMAVEGPHGELGELLQRLCEDIAARRLADDEHNAKVDELLRRLARRVVLTIKEGQL